MGLCVQCPPAVAVSALSIIGEPCVKPRRAGRGNVTDRWNRMSRAQCSLELTRRPSPSAVSTPVLPMYPSPVTCHCRLREELAPDVSAQYDSNLPVLVENEKVGGLQQKVLGTLAPSGRDANAFDEDMRRFGELAACVLLLGSLSLLAPPASLAEGLLAEEPSNALSLPTWLIHVASVVEWVVAMALVWDYGGRPGKAGWRGLAWAMVPLLGGAMCAVTWHFTYNNPDLEVLVVLQGALTFLGNCTLCIAAIRIAQMSQTNNLPKS